MPRRKPRTAKAGRVPDLGRLEVCLKVKDLKRSCAFYETLGYRQVAGDRRKGWAVLERDGFRIDLFHGYITSNVLNYRGGDVPALVAALKARGLRPYKVRIVGTKGAGGALLKDPDGNVIFFDTTPRERTLRKRRARS